MFQYITNVEMMLVMKYHIDPYSFEKNLSIFDLQSFIIVLNGKIKEEDEAQKRNGQNKLLQSLAAIRDILNFMPLPGNDYHK